MLSKPHIAVHNTSHQRRMICFLLLDCLQEIHLRASAKIVHMQTFPSRKGGAAAAVSRFPSRIAGGSWLRALEEEEEPGEGGGGRGRRRRRAGAGAPSLPSARKGTRATAGCTELPQTRRRGPDSRNPQVNGRKETRRRRIRRASSPSAREGTRAAAGSAELARRPRAKGPTPPLDAPR
jgi:hypothetical protein